MIATTGLKGLRIECIVGVYPHEREHPQPVMIDVELDYDVADAAHADDVGHAVDYDRVAEGVTELVQRRAFHLIETMAEETADMLLGQHASVQTVRLEIRKPKAVAAADCSFVRLVRARP
jgi:dihydroneopterin aldolase